MIIKKNERVQLEEPSHEICIFSTLTSCIHKRMSKNKKRIYTSIHCKENLPDSWICYDQTLLGLGFGRLFPARESLVSDILAGDGNLINLFLQCRWWMEKREGYDKMKEKRNDILSHKKKRLTTSWVNNR